MTENEQAASYRKPQLNISITMNGQNKNDKRGTTPLNSERKPERMSIVLKHFCKVGNTYVMH